MRSSSSASSSLSSSSSSSSSTPAASRSAGRARHTTRGNGRSGKDHQHSDAVSEGYPEDYLFDDVAPREFITVPEDCSLSFHYLHETQLYLFDVVRKMNRLRTKDKRVCFITDYTINLASPQSGKVSRCSKVEDVAELICDVPTRAVGVRMRNRPFAVEPHDYLHWNCFFEMPVDLLLFAESSKQFRDLIRVLRFVYHLCTKKELACRWMELCEDWEATLVLVPDGSRVKKRAMLYHRVPLLLAGEEEDEATLLELQQRHLQQRRATVQVPQTRGARSASVPGGNAQGRGDPSAAASPPLRPPPRRSFSGTPAPSQSRTAAAERPAPPVAAAAVSVGDSPPYQQLSRNSPFNAHSSTRRSANPLARGETATEAPAASSTPSQPASARSRPRLSTTAVVCQPEKSDLFSPTVPPDEKRTSRKKLKALEEMVKEQQLCISELLQSRYSKECELDDLKRQMGSASSVHHARDWDTIESEPQQDRLITNKPIKRKKAKAASAAATAAPPAVRDDDGTNRKARSPAERHHRRSTKHHSEGASTEVREAEQKLEDALRRHRHFEKAVWAYYKELPCGLREQLYSYQDTSSPALHYHRQPEHSQQHHSSRHHEHHSHQYPHQTRRSSTEQELRYLQQLVALNEKARVQAAEHSDSSAQATESLAVVGDQIDAFAAELARKQLEIDRLRHQLSTVAHGAQ